jgi:UDP-N-acetylglucosamine 2-epimerase (non-hydrolysing)
MLKPKLLVIDSNYPSKSNLYGDVFVHSRLKHYVQKFEIQVLGMQYTLDKNESYTYEGIPVFNVCSQKAFKDYLDKNTPDLIAIHFVEKWMYNVIKEFKGCVFVWVHGYEALGWYRRLFNYRLKNILGLFRYILANTRQMYFMHQFIRYSNKTGKVKFIFVSDWMRRITQTDTFSKIKNYEIIPNPIDETLFVHQTKEPELRKKVLLIRSFDSTKYANDIAIKAIEILSKENIFKDIEFSIYGKGKYFYPLTREIKKFTNVNLYNIFIENKDIPLVHKDYGIFLCPTRQDAQGVSMCEAMSSGLIPISSNNTAIPEFVTHQQTGYLTNSSQEIADTIKMLYYNPSEFLKVSQCAALSIIQKSGSGVVIKKEMNMMLNELYKKKILLAFGTRPEAIKMAPLVLALKSCDMFHVRVCVTAQHRQMLDQVLNFYEIDPDYDLDLMRPNQTLNMLTADILTKIKSVFDDFSPDCILVHGDTTTSMAVALAGFYSNIKVGHVEAGLRTYNKHAPFPEEINRQITGRIADYHFAPTEQARQNLLNEHVPDNAIFVTGNTVIDALMYSVNLLKAHEHDDIKILKNRLNLKKEIILVTGHRRENFGEGFINICNALKIIAHKFADIQILYPVHLNPNVQKPVYEILGNVPNILLIKPLTYPAFVWVMSNSKLIITDSGGVQEEAPSLGKPVLVLRNTTERPEAVDAGTVILVGTDTDKIVSETVKLLQNEDYYNEMSMRHNPYGDGKACERIIEKCMEKIGFISPAAPPHPHPPPHPPPPPTAGRKR